MAIELIVNKDRKKLSEGRNHGEGFAFLKKEGDTYTEVHPKSACKDYLNDIVYCENFKGSCLVHGLNYSYLGIFKNLRYVYLSVAYLSTDSNSLYDKELNSEYLKEVPAIVKQVNEFEINMGYKLTTIVQEINNSIIIKIDRNWVKSQFRISLYALLFRYAHTNKGIQVLREKLNKELAIKAINEGRDIRKYEKCVHHHGVNHLESIEKTRIFKEKNNT